MTVKPSYGIEALHLGQRISDVISVFGEPERRRQSGSLREYYVYHSLGFECIVSTKTGRILSLFFRREGARFLIEEFHWPAGAVNDRYVGGLTGGGLSIGEDYFNRWASFDSGIGFQFDRKGRVTVVSVFAKRRRSNAEARIRPERSAVHQIAA